MLVVGINAPADPRATESTVFGPFFVDGAPEVPLGGDIANGATGTPCWVTGTRHRHRRRRRSPAPGSTSGRPTRTASTTSSSDGDGRPAAGGCSSGPDGGYRVLVGAAVALPDPRRRARSASCSPPPAAARCGPPTCTSWSTRPGHRTLVTHIFVAGDAYLGQRRGVRRQGQPGRRRSPSTARHRPDGRALDSPVDRRPLRHRPGEGRHDRGDAEPRDRRPDHRQRPGRRRRGAAPGHLRRRPHGRSPSTGWTANTPRAHITNQRTMEVFRDLGIEDRTSGPRATPARADGRDRRSAPASPATRSAGSAPGARIPRRMADYTEASPSQNCDLPQTLLEPIVIGHAASRGAGSGSTPSTSRLDAGRRRGRPSPSATGSPATTYDDPARST